MPSLRLLSVNARTMSLDRAALARTIAEVRPDLACVHGAPSLLRWRSISAELAREAGLVVVSGGRTAGGNLLMSTLGVDVLTTRDLTYSGGRGVRPPGAALAMLRLRGSEFAVTGARLTGDAGKRLEQTSQLSRAVDGLTPGDPPLVLAVDGAGGPGSSAWQALGETRVAVAGGVFVDARIGIADVNEISGGAVRVELALPGV